jgi:rubredoxin
MFWAEEKPTSSVGIEGEKIYEKIYVNFTCKLCLIHDR